MIPKARREELRKWIGSGREGTGVTGTSTSHRYLNDLELLSLLDLAERVEEAQEIASWGKNDA